MTAGTKSRDKGKSGELEVVHLLRQWFPDAERNLTETREGQGIDIMNTAPFGIQVKRYADVAPNVVTKAWNEAVDGVDNHTGPEVKCPIVLHRSDRQPWQLTISQNDLVGMYCKIIPGSVDCLATIDARAFFMAWEENGRPGR